MRIIPVLDLKAGQAVHAVAGDRAHYRPLRSVLHEGSDPLGLARALRKAFGCEELYLADLDAIAGAAPDQTLYRELADLGLRLWVDAGIRTLDEIPSLLEAGVSTIVAGLESLPGPAALSAMIERHGPSRIVFSLDLRDGRPLVDTARAWGTDNPLHLARMAFLLRIERLLILDLARVGTGTGTGTLELLQQIRPYAPRSSELIVGGGVTGPKDLPALAQAGASAVLIGSALHNGRLRTIEAVETQNAIRQQFHPETEF